MFRRQLFFVVTFVHIWAISLTAFAQIAIDETVERDLPKMLELYRWFHANPELSRQEKATAARLADEMRAAGLEVVEGVGGHGILGVLRGQPGGPVVLYRADMDGLPVTEKTGLPYASKNKGVMHACGHDIHMSVAVAAMRAMNELKQHWKGTILFVGQPAEEVGAGAEAMLEDPRFEAAMQQAGGKPILAFALHDNASLAAGQIALSPGYVSANVDSVDIIVHGIGGHGAYPENTIDPIVIGAEIVSALQTIVSRRLPPGTRAVVTVGKFAAGSKHNIIPPRATLLLTVRSYEEEVRTALLKEIERVAINVARAHAVPRDPEVNHSLAEYTPSGYNDPEWTGRLRRRFTQILGEENIKETSPTMAGEDFSEYSRRLKIPGVMFSLGAVNAQKAAGGEVLPGLHSDLFAPDPEPTIRTGARLVVHGLLEALQ